MASTSERFVTHSIAREQEVRIAAEGQLWSYLITTLDVINVYSTCEYAARCIRKKEGRKKGC